MPRRSVRLRLTALYGALFLVAGVGLLAVTYGLVVSHRTAAVFRLTEGQSGVFKGVPLPEGAVLEGKKLAAFQRCIGSSFGHYTASATPAGAAAVMLPNKFGLVCERKVGLQPGPLLLGKGQTARALAAKAAPGTQQAVPGTERAAPVGGGLPVPSPVSHAVTRPVLRSAAVTAGGRTAASQGACQGKCQFAVPGPGVVVLPKGAAEVLKQRLASGNIALTFQTDLPTPGELRTLLEELGVALALMVLVSVGLGWAMAGRVLRPLRTMTATARQISEENLHERLAVSGPQDELKDLADTIDGLLTRLDTAFEGQKRFVANASHEMRTPLAMMRTSVDVALAKPGGPTPEVAALGHKLEEGLDLADRLLEGLLVLARAQKGAVGQPEEIALGPLVRRAFETGAAAADEKALRLDNRVVTGRVRGNPLLVTRAVANLVDNAVRHNVQGGTVRAEIEQRPASTVLVVENTGPVVPPDALAHLGEPFYRVGGERLVGTGGIGLGLSVVQAVAAAHGGALRLRAPAQGGLRAELELPSAAGGPSAGPAPPGVGA